MNQFSKKNIDSYILIGGQSRRFGSNKANFSINNQSFLEIIKSTISAIFNDVYVVGKQPKQNEKEHEYYLQDIFESQSPLVGLLTILKHCKNEWCFVISVDMPFINLDIIQKLFKLIDNKYDIIIPKLNEKNMPLCGFYKKSNFEYILNSFNNGNLKLLKSIQSRNILEVEFDNNPFELSNINTKSELFRILNN